MLCVRSGREPGPSRQSSEERGGEIQLCLVSKQTPESVRGRKEDISPLFYEKIVWPEDSPLKKTNNRVMKFPQGTGARKWLQYYEDKEKAAREKEATKLMKLQERKRKKEEKDKVKAAKKKKIRVSDDESSFDEEIEKEIENLPDSSGGEWDETYGMSEDEEVADESNFLEEVASVDHSDWVLVEFEGKKEKLFYVGLVVENRKTENNRGSARVLVNFLKKEGKTSSYIFPMEKDEGWVDLRQIKKVLPTPEIRRGHHSFPCKYFPANIKLV